MKEKEIEIGFRMIDDNTLEITLYDYFLSSDIDRDGSRRINVYSFSAIDHWWNYRTCNVTFIKSQSVYG